VDDTPTRTPPQLQDFPETGVNSLASFGQRFGGWLIDLGITVFPVTLISLPFIDVRAVADDGALPAWLLALNVGIWLIYQTVMVAAWGKTLGKWAVGVRVARYDNGNNPKVDQAALRALLPSVFPVIPVPFVSAGWVLVYMSSLYNPLRRGFHDLAGGTVVIRTR
jgi:uncharacterized RDD family membrane protein YckC